MISDSTVAHLRTLAEHPDLTATSYTIVREIARGGMAVVYEARDARLDRTVALKVLALELSSAGAARRMRDEARTIARLEHPGIIPIHDIGELPDGRVFYTMKLVRGTTLKEFATDRGRAELPRIFLRICDAVGFAHASGVVHRDLKPDNIMVGGFGEVMVMDWGVAASIDATGDVAGTRGFMAPEQLRGRLPISARTSSPSARFWIGFRPTSRCSRLRTKRRRRTPPTDMRPRAILPQTSRATSMANPSSPIARTFSSARYAGRGATSRSLRSSPRTLSCVSSSSCGFIGKGILEDGESVSGGLKTP